MIKKILLIGLTFLGLHTNVMCTVQAYRKELRLGDRFSIENILIEIFGPSIEEITLRNIITHSTIFGGPCDLYASVSIMGKDNKPLVVNGREECFGGPNDFKLPVLGKSSVLREALLIKTCYEICEQPAAIQHALRIVGNEKGKMTAEQINKAYQLFYPFDLLPSQEIKIFTSNKSHKKFTWKKIFLAFCLSSSWQHY